LAYDILNPEFTQRHHIVVQWSDAPYSSWNGPATLKENVNSNDICAVTAFGGNKIGVLWSNQRNDRFQFKYHTDGQDPNSWSSLEQAAKTLPYIVMGQYMLLLKPI
jgi:hypothetical protein